jgi:phytoene desaturase
VLFEARDKAGGRAYVYEQDGFAFDGGPTVITAPECLRELFRVAGRDMDGYVELLPVAPFYRLIWSDGSQFDYGNDTEALLSQIRGFQAKDVDGYRRFLDYSKRVYSKGYEELAATPFLRFADMLRVSPDLIRLRADRSVYQTVSRFISDERLRQAFSFHSLLVGGNPFDTSAIYTLIHFLERNWGVFFPKGGTGSLIAALVRLFSELGGELRLATPVESIAVEHSASRVVHRVQSRLGEEPFDAVVSNADLHHTYARLYREQKSARAMTRRLERSEWSMSLFVLYFGTRGRYDNLAHHTILFGPRYEELLREIFQGPNLPADFSLYLHAPCVTDPEMAPAGHGAYYVLCPVPHLGVAPLDWEKLGPELERRIVAHLERLMPDLGKRIVSSRFITPQHFESDLAAYKGSAFSISPRLTQSAWFRPHNRDDNIPGLYIVGAGTHPGAGLPGVINSAKATTKLVLEDFGMANLAEAAE